MFRIRLIKSIVLTAVALGVVGALSATAGGAAARHDSQSVPLPGDTAVRFWPHETGALMGTSETYVDVAADGSYYDPSLGRRVPAARAHARGR